MRVLHVMPSIASRYGGPARSVWGYAEAARRAGADVGIAAPMPGPDTPQARAEAGRIGVDLQLFPSVGRGAFVASPALLRWLDRAGDAADVVHVHGLLNPISSLAARRCRLRGWPHAIRPFGTLSRYTFSYRRSALKSAYLRVLDGPNLRQADAVHFTTTGEQRGAAWHGLPLGRAQYVIPPPWTGSRASATPLTTQPVVLCLGRLHPVKNVEAVIAAWPVVVRSQPAATLVIAGDGDVAYTALLKSLVAQSGLERAVEFVGFVSGEAKARLMASARAFVLTSHHENFGVAIQEALAAGLPAIVADELPLADLVREHGLGAATAIDPESLGTAIARVLADESLVERCRHDAPRVIEETFCPERIGAKLMTMYTSICAGR